MFLFLIGTIKYIVFLIGRMKYNTLVTGLINRRTICNWSYKLGLALLLINDLIKQGALDFC